MPQPPTTDIWPLPDKIIRRDDRDFDHRLRRILEHIERHGPHGGGTGGWDAIVDGALTASDPDARQFKGIGEALDWLYTNVPFMNNTESTCAIYVRNGNNGVLGRAIYTETADWDSPADVLLFGGGPGDAGLAGTSAGFDWRPGNFNPLQANTQYTLYNCGNLNIVKTTGGFEWGNLKLINSVMNSSNSSGSDIFSVVECHNSSFFNGIPNRLGTYVWFDNCYLDQNAQATAPAGTAGGVLVMTGCRLAGTGTINLPQRFHIDVRGDNATGGLGPMPGFVVPTGASAVVGYIKVSECISTAPSVTATDAFGSLILEGEFLTVVATGAHDVLMIRGNHRTPASTWQIAGPAQIDLNLDANLGSGTAALQLSGTRIEASITGKILSSGTNPGTMRTAIRCVGLTYSNLRAALNATGFTVGMPLQPFSFDAASTDNLLIRTGQNTFPDAGTDSGTNNVVGPPWTGPAAIAFGSPVSIGTANSDGVAGTAPRADHVHAHPVLATGDLHPEYRSSWARPLSVMGG